MNDVTLQEAAKSIEFPPEKTRPHLPKARRGRVAEDRDAFMPDRPPVLHLNNLCFQQYKKAGTAAGRKQVCHSSRIPGVANSGSCLIPFIEIGIQLPADHPFPEFIVIPFVLFLQHFSPQFGRLHAVLHFIGDFH